MPEECDENSALKKIKSNEERIKQIIKIKLIYW